MAVFIKSLESPFAIKIYPMEKETALNTIPKIPQRTISIIGTNSLEYKSTIMNGAAAKKITIMGRMRRMAIKACSRTVWRMASILSEIADNLGK